MALGVTPKESETRGESCAAKPGEGEGEGEGEERLAVGGGKRWGGAGKG